MFTAYDGEGRVVSIESANRRSKYFCPICLSELTVKNRGIIKAAHFAHKNGASDCQDTWQNEHIYDSPSKWHDKWEKEFPVENREVVLTFGDVKHIADVVVDKTVIEFQHSSLSYENFGKRTNFYHDCGCKMIWLFDYISDYQQQKINTTDGINFTWDKQRNTFDYFDSLLEELDIFFQLKPGENGDRCIVRVRQIIDSNMRRFSIDKWFSVEEFLVYVGKTATGFPLPNINAIDQDPDYDSFKKRFNVSFNIQQERAIQRITGTTLLLAVPGSGKTTTLVGRLGYMTACKGIDPDSILALTYTKAAAKHMAKLYADTYGIGVTGSITFKTINGFCAEVIKRANVPFILCSEKIRHKILRDAYKSHNNVAFPQKSDLITLENHIGFAKNMMMKESEIQSTKWDIENFLEIYKDYERELRAINQKDFDDQMIVVLKLFRQRPDLLEFYQNKYEFVCLDESQDTSKLQHEIIKMLCKKSNNLFLVGDEDQSIYGYRGAYPHALLSIKNEYSNPFILKLETNYRSKQEIIDIANKFISRNKNRISKKMTSSRGSGGTVNFIEVKDRDAQYQAIIKAAQECSGSIGIIYRNNDCAIPLIDLFDRNNIPFSINKQNESFFTNYVVSDIKKCFQFSLDHNSPSLLEDIYKKFSLQFRKDRISTTISYWREKNNDLLDEIVEQSKYYKGNEKYRQKMRSASIRFRDTFMKIKDMPPVQAIDELETLGYRQYANKNQLGTGTLDLLKSIAKQTATISEFLTRLRELEVINKEKMTSNVDSRISLASIHSAKGREFDDVILFDVFDGILPSSKSQEVSHQAILNQYDEERRLFYVAITRAKDSLIIMDIKNEHSEFLDELRPHRKEMSSLPAIEVATSFDDQMYLDPDNFIEGNTVISKTILEPNYIKKLLLTAGSTYGSIESKTLELLRGYYSEGQLGKFLTALQDAKIYACGKDFMILLVTSENAMTSINDLRDDQVINNFCATFFQGKRDIIALTEDEIHCL